MDDTLENILNQLPVGDRKKLLNLIKLEEEGQDLPILEEIQKTNELLQQLVDKPELEIPSMPEIPLPKDEVSVNNLPDIQKVEITNKLPTPKIEIKPANVEIDLSETNDLLQRLLNKKDEVIEATLEII